MGLILVRRMQRALVILLVIAFSAAPVDTHAIEVRFGELVKHPQKYNGERVSVRAYVVTSCTHCGEFWSSVQAARDSRVHDSPVLQCIAIGGYRRGYLLPKWYRANRMLDGFHGFGWSRLDDKQITDITELRPVGPPIPAHIN